MVLWMFPRLPNQKVPDLQFRPWEAQIRCLNQMDGYEGVGSGERVGGRQKEGRCINIHTSNFFFSRFLSSCCVSVSFPFSPDFFKRISSQDFPRGPVVKTPSVQCRGCTFDPCSGK